MDPLLKKPSVEGSCMLASCTSLAACLPLENRTLFTPVTWGSVHLTPKPSLPGQSDYLWWGQGRGRKEGAHSYLNCKTTTAYNSFHEGWQVSSLFRMFIAILHMLPTSLPPCTFLAFVPCNFHQFVSFLSDVLKAQQELIQSNTNFPVCCIIKCSAWCVHSPPVIKCQLQQCLVPPGSSCCHFHFPPRTKHLKTKKS